MYTYISVMPIIPTKQKALFYFTDQYSSSSVTPFIMHSHSQLSQQICEGSLLRCPVNCKPCLSHYVQSQILKKDSYLVICKQTLEN